MSSLLHMIVGHVSNLSTQETEAEGSQFQIQSGVNCEDLPQGKKVQH